MNPSGILAKILRKNGTGDLLANMSKDLGEYAASAPINKMYGTHSLSASKLAGADSLGGFAMPSVAVRNANAVNGSKLSEFGDVVMIPKGDTFLPSRNTKVFSTDAYTPMMPYTVAEADPAMWAQLTGKYPGLNKYGKNSFDVNYDLTAQSPVDNATTLYDLLKYGDIDPGADDFYKYREMLREGNMSDDVKGFIDEVGGVAGPKMFNAGHTHSGQRRLKDYTLENAIKIMKADIKGNSGAVHGSVGSPSAMGVMEASNSKPITSLKEMRERSKWLNADPLDMEKYGLLIDNKDMMSLPHTGKYREMNKGMMSRLNETANELYKTKTGKDWVIDSNPFTNYDTQMNILGDLEWYMKNNPGYVDDIAEMTGPLGEFKNILNNQPVKYFESKPLRGVGFDEWEGAVLPEGDELAREILSKRGVPILGNYNSAEENALEMLMAKLVKEGKIPLYASTGMLGGGSILNALMGGGAEPSATI